MNARKMLLMLFWLGILFQVRLWTRMPERVAMHFGPDGQPNGWSGKDTHLLLVLGLHVFFFLMFYFLPNLIDRIPVQFVNLPNREFWFRPENRGTLRRKLGEAMAQMGILMMLFFGFMAYETFQANLRSPVHLDNARFFVVMILFFAGITVWSIRFYFVFKKPVSNSGEKE